MIEIIVGTNRRGSLSQVLGKCLLDKYLELSVEAQLMSLQDLPLKHLLRMPTMTNP